MGINRQEINYSIYSYLVIPTQAPPQKEKPRHWKQWIALVSGTEKLLCTFAKLECEKIACSHIFAVLIHTHTWMPNSFPSAALGIGGPKVLSRGFLRSDRKGGPVSEQFERYHDLTKQLANQVCLRIQIERRLFE